MEGAERGLCFTSSVGLVLSDFLWKSPSIELLPSKSEYFGNFGNIALPFL